MFNSFAYGATSDDIYVRKDVFDLRMNRIEELITEIRQDVREIRQEVNEVKVTVGVLIERTDGLKTAIYWGLTVAGMILALAVFGPGLVKIYQMIFKPSITLEDVQRLIEANNAKIFAGK